MKKDWRADLSGIDNLYDVDPGSILVFLRHQYLLTAKDMMRNKEEWNDMGLNACMVVESLQAALETQVSDALNIENF